MYEGIIFPSIVFFAGFLTGLFIILLLHPDDFRTLSSIFSLAFFIRAALSISFYLISSDGFLFKNDGWAYHGNGWTIVKMKAHGVQVTPETFYGHSYSGTISNYDFWNAFVYSFTGKSPLSLFLINTAAGSLAVIFIYLIAKDLFGRKAAIVSSILCAIWPSLIMWSTQNMKEPITNLAVCSLMWALINLRYRFRFSYIIIGIFSCYILMQLRFFTLPVFFFIIPLWWLVSFKRVGIVLFLFSISAIAILLFHSQILGCYDIISRWLIKCFERIEVIPSLLSFVDYSRSVRASGATAIMPGYQIHSIWAGIIFLPVGIIYVWLSPFPWQLGSAGQMLALPEMSLFYLLLPYTLYGFIFSLKNKMTKSYILIFFILLTSILLGLFEGNVGTIFRHRSMMLYFIFIFTAVGIVSLSKGRRNRLWALNIKPL